MKLAPARLIGVVLAILIASAILPALPALAEPVSVDTLGSPSLADQKIQNVADAITRFKNGDFDGAAALLKKAVAENADLPPAQVIMAQLFAQAQQAPAARGALQRAVADDPNDPEAYAILGDIALRDGGLAEAEFMLNKANTLLDSFQKSPRRKKILVPRVLASLASVAEAREAWPTAQKHLEAWAAADAENVLALQRLGRVFFLQKKPDLALEKFKAAAKINRDVLTPEALLAQFYEDSGDREKAAEYMLAALKTAPKDLKTRLVAAQWSLQTEQLDQAKEQAVAAIALDPNSLEAKLLRGLVALFQKDWKTAELYFENAHLQSPANFPATNNLSLALCEQNDEAKKRRAREYADVNVQRFPRLAEAYSTLGWVLYRMGRLDEAEQALRTAASSGSVSADTAYYLAVISVERNRTGDAKQLLEGALRSRVPFTLRKDAQDLLIRLNVAQPQQPSTQPQQPSTQPQQPSTQPQQPSQPSGRATP